jgi:hypothetical protein
VITPSFLRETLMLYASGNSCSLIEMHMFLVTLIRQFEFALPDNAPKIESRRPATTNITPIVKGEEHKGTQLPLKITRLENE